MREPAALRGSSQAMLKRLGGATLNYGLGRVLPKVAGFLLIPLYTAFLSPGDFGVLDLATTFAGVLFMLMRFGVPGAVSRFYYDHREGVELRDFLTTIGWFQIAASIVVGGIALLAWPLLSASVLPGVSLVPIGLLIVTSTVLTGLSDIQRRVIQAREQSAYSAALSTITAVIQIGSAVVFVAVLRLGVYGMLLSFLVSGAVSYAQALHYLAPDLRGRFQVGMLREALKYSSGILPSQVVGAFAPLANRALLASNAGLADVGVLAIATRFASPLAILVAAFSAAYLPIYFSMRNEDSEATRAELARSTRNTWTIALIVTLGIVMMGPPAIRVMVPSEFFGAAALLPVVALGGLAEVVYVLLSPEIYYTKKSWLVPLVSLTTAVCSFGLTALLVGHYGAMGVAWATAGGLAASSAVGALISLRLVRIPFAWGRMARTTVLCGLCSVVGLYTSALPLMVQVTANGCAVLAFVGILVATRDPVVAEALGRLRRSR